MLIRGENPAQSTKGIQPLDILMGGSCDKSAVFNGLKPKIEFICRVRILKEGKKTTCKGIAMCLVETVPMLS